MDILFIQIDKRKYVVMYVNEADADYVVHKLMQLKYVRDIDGHHISFKENL